MSEKKVYNVLFCGIGGQGILKASEICGLAAMYEGYRVKKSEIHGMSQRGGSVESHLRFGKEVFSPIIPYNEVDYLVPFYKEEHERLLTLLKKDGVDLIPFLEEAEKNDIDPKFINTFMLGGLSNYLPIKEENWINAINTVFDKFLDKNVEIFLLARRKL